MTRKILRALKKTVKHWGNNVTGKENSWAGSDCELCVLSTTHTCYIGGDELCPVRKKTGNRQCAGTPWEEIRVHVLRAHLDDHIYRKREFLPGCPECDRLKLKEFEFLKSLLPKRKKRK